MAKVKESKAIEGYNVVALKSAAGPIMLKKGGEYKVPEQIPTQTAEEFIKAGLVQKIQSKTNTLSRSAGERETR